MIGQYNRLLSILRENPKISVCVCVLSLGNQMQLPDKSAMQLCSLSLLDCISCISAHSLVKYDKTVKQMSHNNALIVGSTIDYIIIYGSTKVVLVF